MPDKNLNVDEWLKSQGMGEEVKTEKPAGELTNSEDSPWDKIILPKSTYLVMGDVGVGKSALSFWLMERYAARLKLKPCVVGFPQDKRKLLPDNFEIIDDIDKVASCEDAFIFVDEAGMQLPLDDYKVREKVTNFLQLHRQRRQLLLLGYHYPRLILARYLPFLAGFFLKRPPYLKEFASKSKTDSLAQMMDKAEERFSEMIPPGWEPTAKELQPLEVKRHTYVVSPRLRWQGVMSNPTPSFWTESLSEVWAGTKIDNNQEVDAPPTQSEMSTSGLMDLSGKIPITDRMLARSILFKEEAGKKIFCDPSTNIYWET
jgi:hypothetical protein